METPAQISAQSQSEIISHYRSQGYRLRCYGDLGPRERIRNDDYLCLAPISSAFAFSAAEPELPPVMSSVAR